MMSRDQCLASANDIQGWMTYQELAWLYDVSRQYDTAAHIGVWRGRSIVAAAGGIRQRIYAIDNWRDNDVLECRKTGIDHGVAFIDAMRTLWPWINAGKCVPLAMDSTAAARLLPEVDMVFIDGAHDRSSVERDIDAWLPRTRSLLAGHDAPEVQAAIASLNWRPGPDQIWMVEL